MPMEATILVMAVETVETETLATLAVEEVTVAKVAVLMVQLLVAVDKRAATAVAVAV